MLFILVMDALSMLFLKAEEEGFLSPVHARQDIPQRLSVYADDVILFMNPSTQEANTIKFLLQAFGGVSGLCCNMSKSSITPITCDSERVNEISSILACKVESLPIKYLGLPLHFKKARKEDFHNLLDKIKRRLAAWKTHMLTQGGRLILVQSVLSAMAIFHLMSLNPPPWFFKAIDKIRRAFLWKGTETVSGGHCLVAWPSVCRPKPKGGLGIMDLEIMHSALQVSWAWNARTADKAWSPLMTPVDDKVRHLFNAAARVDLGNGEKNILLDG